MGINTELLTLRDRLRMQRRQLIDGLATDAGGAEGGRIEPAFVALLADLQTAIAAVDAELAESVTTGDAP